ncbi:MAG: hypothetical protein SF066_05095 [Thermoanaerobaculia bacterium]|nr:hypothetical protein [Thermoanaerobaculia bacterium]
MVLTAKSPLRRRLVRWLASPRLPLYAALVSVLLCAPSLGIGFQLDDWFQRNILLGEFPVPVSPFGMFSTALDATDGAAVGVFPWWVTPDFKLAFLRPVSVLTHLADYALWPNSPVLMHLHSLLWLGAGVWVAGGFYRRLLGVGWAAGLAALFFALDDSHGLPAGWIANRNALVAFLFGLLAVLAHDRWRREGWRLGAWAAPVLLGLGLFAGETAVGAVAFLGAYALFFDEAGARRGLLALLPCAVAGLVWAAVYHLGDYGAVGSGMYVEPLGAPGEFLRALFERVPILTLGLWTPLAADFAGIAPPEAQPVLWGLGVAVLIFAVGLFGPLVRRDRLARFFAAGTLFALVPASATQASNRLLLFVGLAAFGLLARWLQGRSEAAAWLPTGSLWRRTAGAAAVGAFATHLVLAPPSLVLHSLAAKTLGAPTLAATEDLPADAALPNQTLVFINTPDYLMFVAYLQPYRQAERKPVPRALRALSQGPTPVELVRLDDQTLRIDVPAGLYGGQLGGLFRGPRQPFRVGEEVTVPGMTVTIDAVDDRGVPQRATYRFTVPLEDPSLRWVAWQGGRFVAITPPAAGEVLRLEPAVLKF